MFRAFRGVNARWCVCGGVCAGVFAEVALCLRRCLRWCVCGGCAVFVEVFAGCVCGGCAMFAEVFANDYEDVCLPTLHL